MLNRLLRAWRRLQSLRPSGGRDWALVLLVGGAALLLGECGPSLDLVIPFLR